MIDKDAVRRVPTSPNELHDHTSWKHPSRNMQIHMHASAVRMLSTESLRLLKAQEPSELGGILRGEVRAGANDGVTVVLFPQIVPSETHLFNATEADSQNLVAALQRPAQNGLPAMGYFRSHIRDGLCLSQRDEVVIQQHLRDPESIFLVIRPFEIGICMAGFFFWEDGRLQTDVSELEVPFVVPDDGEHLVPHAKNSQLDSFKRLADGLETSLPRPATPNGNTPFVRRRSKATDLAVEAPAPSVESRRSHGSESIHIPMPLVNSEAGTQDRAKQTRSAPVGRRSKHLRSLPWKLVLWPVISVVACLGLYFVTARSGLFQSLSPTPVSKTEIGLQVKVGPGGQIDLSWDQSSTKFQKAQGATLTIIDGAIRRELDIDKNQLRFGKLTYFPNSDDVQFDFEVHLNANRSIAESVRVLPPKTATARLRMPSDSPHTPPGIEPNLVQPRSGGQHIRTSALPPQNVRTTTIQLPSQPSASRVRGPLAIAANSLVAVRPASPRPIPPPSLELLTGGLNISAPDIRFFAVPLPSPPQPKTQTSTLAETQPAINSPVYVPARPTKQIMPNKAPFTPSKIYRAVSITVQVKINERGSVDEVRLIPSESGNDAVLASQAIAAAKQWAFEPARLHGKSIPSEHTIVFRFRPAE